MPAPSLLVTAPLLAVSDPIRAALAARAAGANVRFVGLADAAGVAGARARFQAAGIASDWIEVPAVAAQRTGDPQRGGETRPEVPETVLPPAADVDRLLDLLGERVAAGVSRVVVAGDLDGGPRIDFAERVVGRAWGLGVRTLLAVSGAALKQAFHTQPFGAFVRELDLATVSPPDGGAVETPAQTLARIFEDPVRILLVLAPDGRVRAERRGASIELGVLGDHTPGELMGALAARADEQGDVLEAARQAFAQRAVAPAAERMTT